MKKSNQIKLTLTAVLSLLMMLMIPWQVVNCDENATSQASVTFIDDSKKQTPEKENATISKTPKKTTKSKPQKQPASQPKKPQVRKGGLLPWTGEEQAIKLILIGIILVSMVVIIYLYQRERKDNKKRGLN